jgi:tetratricopeptide (TPR) repeat protein
MGRYDDAIEVYRNVLRTVPNHPAAVSELETIFYVKGMYEEALKFGRAAAAVTQLPGLEEAIVRGFDEGGYLEAYSRAAETLVALSGRTHVAPYLVAWYYTAAGQRQEALDWLERGVDQHDPMMLQIGEVLAFETLRDDPRFEDLLRRMNFPEDVIARTLEKTQ